jgi:hypothetical protein
MFRVLILFPVAQQTPLPSSSKQKQHYLRSTANINTNSKQQQEDSDIQPLQLPPISDIMACPAQNLSIPFFFYHSKFGIEDSLVQWVKGRKNNS